MPKSYNHLTRDQRSQIYALKSNNFTQDQVAQFLGVHASTISRELNRNKGERGYRFQQADGFATERRSLASSRVKCMTPDVIECIEIKIREKWSPVQISGRLKLELGISVSHETIYQHIWRDNKNGGDLYRRLRHSEKKYNKRLRSAGVSFEDRQDLLGHKSSRITTHYSTAELQNLWEAANKVSVSHAQPTLILLRTDALSRVKLA
jgi:IS30 family transposase